MVELSKEVERFSLNCIFTTHYENCPPLEQLLKEKLKFKRGIQLLLFIIYTAKISGAILGSTVKSSDFIDLFLSSVSVSS